MPGRPTDWFVESHDGDVADDGGQGTALASSSTLSRLETRADLVALNRGLVEPFIASQARAPRELILDIDTSDVPLHGHQEWAPFHGNTTTTAICRCMCSAAKRYWRVSCGPVESMAPSPRRP